ncbi:MAG: arginine--tRNA ligase [Pseudomonadota bacterium]
MKDTIIELLTAARDSVAAERDVPIESLTAVEIARTRDQQHGDFASNLALQLAKPLRDNPRKIADALVKALPASPDIERVEVAGPGFLNFFLNASKSTAVVGQILSQADAYPELAAAEKQRVIVEYVSANPTGPLHVGHGRHAAYGATLANLLRAAGHDVHEEYYVNDAGRQMDILAISTLVRALQQAGHSIELPVAGYRGEYIRDIAQDWLSAHGEPQIAADVLLEKAPQDGDDERKERYIDALIHNAERALGETFTALRTFSKDAILNDIRDDLAGFGVVPDAFFSEASLTTEGALDTAINVLKERDVIYEKEGALWFRATDFDDEKDRVVVRDNGKSTYFASDIAYHLNKRRRGFDVLLDALGSDHHGYIARVRAGLVAMGEPGESLEVQLIQFVSLFRGGEKVAMGTRSGNFVTLRELREEVGNDAARLFYIMRSHDQPLDFDLDLAKSNNKDNPVYYIQYAHARIAKIFRELSDQSLTWDEAAGLAGLPQLKDNFEIALLQSLDRFGDTILSAADKRAPHVLVNYLRDLAAELHSYYNNSSKILEDETTVRNARLALIAAVRVVLRNGLKLLGVSAPEQM